MKELYYGSLDIKRDIKVGRIYCPYLQKFTSACGHDFSQQERFFGAFKTSYERLRHKLTNSCVQYFSLDQHDPLEKILTKALYRGAVSRHDFDYYFAMKNDLCVKLGTSEEESRRVINKKKGGVWRFFSPHQMVEEKIEIKDARRLYVLEDRVKFYKKMLSENGFDRVKVCGLVG